jgi:type IV pilus assembly protein PilC
MQAIKLTQKRKPLANKHQQLLLYEIRLRLQGGSTLITALQDLIDQEKSVIKIRLQPILLKVKNGNSFSQALYSEKLLFDEIINLIDAGEKSHDLLNAIILSDKLLERIEKKSQLFRQAISYPIFLLLICLSSVIFASYLLIPQLKIISTTNQDLAITTQFFLFLISLSIGQWTLLLLTILFFTSLIFYFRKSYFFSKCILKFGVLGKILLYQDIAHFCHHMSACMKIHLNIPVSLTQSSNLFKLSILKYYSQKTVTAILQGKTLSYALTQHPHLPQTLGQTVEGIRGQKQLGEVFETLATHFEELGKKHLQKIQPFIEPLLTLLIGIIIALFIHAIILPLYDGSIV